VNIVPLPVSIEHDAGAFLITPATPVTAEGGAATEAAKLIDALAPAMGFRLPSSEDHAVKNAIHLKIEPAMQDRLGEEGYELEVMTESIVLRARGPAGLFYGVQTLRQLLPPAVFAGQKVAGIEWAVPCVRITDYQVARAAD
jgi:hexosaminidase